MSPESAAARVKKGWEVKKLGDVCERVTVGHVGITSPFYSDTGILFIRTQNIGESGLEFGEVKYITPEFHSSLKKSEVKAGDILMQRVITHSVRCAIAPTNLGIANCANVILVRPGSDLNSEFLAHYIRSAEAQKHLLDRKVGSAQLVVNTGVVQNWPIPIPPLHEQQRIVGVLDEALASLAIAQANTEKNRQSARALFESHLQSIFTQRGEGWVETTLGAEIDLLSGFPFKSAQYTESEKDIRLLRGDNIVQGSLRWLDVKRWPASDTEEYERYRLCTGDVVLAMDRPWVKAGLKRAQIKTEDLPCLLVQRTARLRGNGSLNNRFLVYLISSSAFTQHILGVQSGIGVPHISGQQIKDFEFLKPPMNEQAHIANKLDALASETQRLEGIYQRKLEALAALKKSLLQQAFSGQL